MRISPEHMARMTRVLTPQALRILVILSTRVRWESNQVILTTTSLAREIGVSRLTVTRALADLFAADAIRRVQPGVYEVNPLLVWSGSDFEREHAVEMFHRDGHLEVAG